MGVILPAVLSGRPSSFRPDVHGVSPTHQRRPPGMSPMRHLSGLIRVAPVALLALFVSSPARAQAPQEDGVFVTVPNPITGPAINSQIKPAVEAAKNDRSRNVKKIVFDFNPSDKDA